MGTPEQVKAKQKALMDAAVIGDASSKIVMDRLKNDEDNDGGLSEAFGKFLLPFDIPIWIFWALVCVGTTANWEVMLQQNFEANERAGNKFAKVDPKEMQQKAILYRLASWPN